jgi:hypothetical protein
MAGAGSFPRQLPPTVGQRWPGVTFWAGSLGSIGDTIATSRVMYYGNVPVILNNGSWISASSNVITGTIIPIGSIDIFIGFTKDADRRDFLNIEFPGSIHSAFPEPEKSEEKIGFPFTIFNGESNPNDDPEQIFSFPEDSDNSEVEPELQYSDMFGSDSSEEEYMLPYPDLQGVFFADEANSEQEPPNLIRNPDSILFTIEEGYESEGESTPLYNSEEDAEGSPFRLRMESVWMASLEEHMEATNSNPTDNPANQDNAVNNQANAVNPAEAPQDLTDREVEQWKEAEKI